MSEQQQSFIEYNEFVARHNAAYAGFKAIYETRFPPPEKPAVERDSLFVPVALVIMIIASVVVSGSRTILEFGGGVVGLMAFVMLEGAIVAYAFFRTRRSQARDKVTGIRQLANFGLGLAFTVAVAANVHAVLKDRGIMTADWINTGILILVSVSAPTLAFISGDMLALETVANKFKEREAEQQYQAALKTWHAELDTAWNSQKAKWGVRVDQIQDSGRLPDGRTRALVSAVRPADTDTDGQAHGYGQGYSKRTDARDAVRAHLEQFPDDLKLPVRELAEKLGVGKTTVAEVARELRGKP